MSATSKSTAKKGTKTTEILIGGAAASLAQSVKALSEGIVKAQEMEKTIEQNTLKLIDQEQQLIDAKTALTNTVAQNAVEIELAYKSDSKKFVDIFLDGNKLTAVPTDELTALRAENTRLKADQSTAINKAVQDARAEEQAIAENARKLAEATAKANEAQIKAELTQKDAQIALLTAQVADWKTQLTEERKAGTERAQATSTVVNTGGSGKS